MKNIPSIDKVLKWAKYAGLCGPVLNNLENFLLTKDDSGDETNLEKIFRESLDCKEDFTDILKLYFTLHQLEQRFQVAV